MPRLAMAVLVTIAIVAFGIANSNHVQLSFVVGRSVQIRLIFLLICAFFIGMGVPVFHRLVRRLEHDRRMTRERELQQAIERVGSDIVGE